MQKQEITDNEALSARVIKIYKLRKEKVSNKAKNTCSNKTQQKDNMIQKIKTVCAVALVFMV